MKPKPHDITKPPFYAFPFMGGMTATFGGPKINEFAQIINTENKPIDGLYGAGNAVGGIFYDNYLDGSQLTAAVIWGRIAAQQTAKRAKGAAA
jgi:fumarate reductase flavoprotein subunit